MTLLKDILLAQQDLYKEALAKEVLLQLYNNGDDGTDTGIHICKEKALLLVYLLAKQAGLDDTQEIDPAIAETVQLFTLGFLLRVREEDFMKVATANSNFKKVVDAFLAQDNTDIKSFTVAVSLLNGQLGKFSTCTLKKAEGKLIITIKNSFIPNSLEFANLERVIKILLPPPTYRVEFLIAPTASPEAADSLIRALHNVLKDTLGDKYKLDLTADTINQIRTKLSLFLKDGRISEHHTQPESTISESGSKKVVATVDPVVATVDPTAATVDPVVATVAPVVGSNGTTVAPSDTATTQRSLESKQDLVSIISTLIDNITKGSEGRLTSSSEHKKIVELKRIRDELQKTEPQKTQNDYLHEIMDACKIKRNPIHFWAEPHSVNEFTKLLTKNNIAFPEPPALKNQK